METAYALGVIVVVVGIVAGIWRAWRRAGRTAPLDAEAAQRPDPGPQLVDPPWRDQVRVDVARHRADRPPDGPPKKSP